MQLSRQTILVTGATGTLGSSVVRSLCAQDHHVVAHYHRRDNLAQQLRTETGCELFRADVSCEAQVEALFSHCGGALEACLFAVIHAAAIAKDALLLRQTPGGWNEALSVNADGAFLVARAALRFLPRGGRLILIGSRVGEIGNAGQGAYAATKAAMIALAKVTAREGAEQGISVNVICPGFVPSAMTQNLSPQRLQKARAQSVFNESGSTEELTSTVKWLLDKQSANISGQVIHCDSRI